MSTVPPPASSKSGDNSKKIPDTMIACQAIAFYHSCGCKSNNDLVYFCTTPDCRHEASNLVVGGLPFACGSQQGRSEACKAEDKAKKEFVREVDTADKLQNFVVLPECTKEDVFALVSPWTGPLTPDGEFYSHYRRRHEVKSDNSPSQEVPHPSPGTGTKEFDLEEAKQELQDHFEAEDEADCGEDNEKVSSDLQDKQERDGGDIYEGNPVEDELFVVGDEENENEFVDVELDDDYDIYDDVDIDKNLKGYGEHQGKISNMEKDIERTIHGNMDNAEVSDNAEEHLSKIRTTEKGEHDTISIPPRMEAVEASRNTLSPIHDKFGEMGMTDDLIDFLVATKENGPGGPERRKTTMEMLWSCFSVYR
ncbi:hypothetical protein F4805DRAFT_72817 [Annulohypoxylon moriforme]|nr:hypothetical protein F4805DRAFT_72817 [Annulohypoxylon moriforme]